MTQSRRWPAMQHSRLFCLGRLTRDPLDRRLVDLEANTPHQVDAARHTLLPLCPSSKPSTSM